jgi:hypothetical protein
MNFLAVGRGSNWIRNNYDWLIYWSFGGVLFKQRIPVRGEGNESVTLGE